MEKLIEKIKSSIQSFEQDATLRVAKGNYAAGARSRKESIVLAGLLKEWRKASVIRDGKA